MTLKSYKPTSPGRRLTTSPDFSEITKGKKPEKSLTAPLKSQGGRNVHGRITTRHRGGGHKQRMRIIDWRRDKDGVTAKVAAIEYDPNRSARLALLHYTDGEKRYILWPVGVNVGDILSFGELMAKEGKYAQIRLPSTEVREVLLECKATVGQLGNTEHEIVRIGKAGRNRWKGWRPTVRGLAMNPVDHPHGGGEGKSGQGNPHPVSPWGQQTKGLKTRVNKRTTKFIIKRRDKGVR